MDNVTKKTLALDYLFEVSWEICNKVGGIHTVIATKALTVVNQLHDNYILIGPDVQREGTNYEFDEDPNLLKEWRMALYSDGIRVRIGRWKIEGRPIAVLVDFTSFFSAKDDILKFLWEKYKVDSISGQWDYIEPVLFGYAAGQVIESYTKHYCSAQDKIAAHFHEWMTSSGGLYLRHSAPYIAGVFTTHATVMGRCIAGNGLPLYGELENFNTDELAHRFGVVAKHSLEKTAALDYDCFATVSDLTAQECKHLLGREVSLVTPNGFENDFVWPAKEYKAKRKASSEQMIAVAEACLGIKYDKKPLIVGTSGRYEFKNKGVDVFVDAMKDLAENYKGERPILAYITVPAGNVGPRKDLAAYLNDATNGIDPSVIKNTSHYLAEPQWDPVINRIKDSRLLDPSSPVQLMFVPCYLNGDDGIFDKPYYEMLAGMDISVFPSYYEPWGYTPLESVAFSIPTITTTLAGFGLWVNESSEHLGVDVIERTDTNDAQVVEQLCEAIERYAGMSDAKYKKAMASAQKISETALWKNLFDKYIDAYNIALESMKERTSQDAFEYEGGGHFSEQINFVRQQLVSNKPTWTRLMVERQLPERLEPLEKLSKNLWWSWTPEAYAVFEYIDKKLWLKCLKNPIDFLDKLSLSRMREVAADQTFLDMMDGVYAKFEAYMAEKQTAADPRIAYFSMEYGLHNSLKIYSGGLGILAGDYLKEASDKNVPMVAVGLLYRYGYFTQKLSASGQQEASYEAQNFLKLPITPVRDSEGNWVTTVVAMPGRDVTARVWRCDVGRTELYLLDTDHDLNLQEDRAITYHLYGGDWDNRLKQEIILGIGGIRVLKSLGIKSDVYHCNEGHAAFISIERIRNFIEGSKLSFSEAMEVVRSSSLFTTHTPVPAGHDAFDESMIRQYMSHYPERLGITWDQFINLGKTNPFDPNETFSMSFLACNLSQEVNGVSWLHGEVSKDILGGMWPGYFKDELHIGYVTNGIHMPTWTANVMKDLYAKYFAEGFVEKQYNIPAWQKIHDANNKEIWDARLTLKTKLIDFIKKRVADPSQVRFDSPRQIVQIQETVKPDVLTIGFARRFATYKRAQLLFTNLERLERIVNNKERPVQFVFAGKAHPNDKPGQDIIKRIVEIAAMPQFVGKIIFLQNYDMELARRIVQGVDVWLNTPTRPLEASGTSGEKVVMNGGIHFSVLDGWWVEGYKEKGGWMLPMERTFTDQNFQNEMDAEMVYNTIEESIIPRYYNRHSDNVPHEWVEMIKYSIANISSNFTMNRQLTDYQERFYDKLHERHTQVIANDFALAREMASWKRGISNKWDNVTIESVSRIDMGKETILVDHKYTVEVVVNTAGIKGEDLGVEMVLASQINEEGAVNIVEKSELTMTRTEGDLAYYSIDAEPHATGTFDFAFRVFPKNAKLPHRMDFALVKWA